MLLAHAALLALLLLAAAGAGTLALGAQRPLALRAALGLALLGHALFLLATIGSLRPWPIALVMVVLWWSAVALGGRTSAVASGAAPLVFLPLFLLALYPPLAFDETLYHLPFVRSLAESGALRFHADMRFPVFPQLHELLCVPLQLVAGDVATHLVSLAEVIVTAALLVEWGKRSGLLAAALFLGSPIVVQLATVGYADAALTLFVAAGFYCLAHDEPLLAGVFLGTACSVKYLGGFFVVAGLVLARNRRYLAGCLATALPTTLWLLATTGNPVFPFFGSSPWSVPLPAVDFATRIVRTIRVPFDVTFARERINFQPPFTPLLSGMIAIVLAASLRDARARAMAILGALYLVAFSFLPQDSRYLVPLLPLLAIVSATTVTARWPKLVPLLAIVAVAPGIAYAAHRLYAGGWPPATPAAREAMLAQRIPEHRALRRADAGTIYVCGAEQLKAHARGKLLGDHAGPYSFDRIVNANLAANLRRIDARWYLVAKRVCPPPSANGLELVYEDAAAQLWRVRYDSRPSAR